MKRLMAVVIALALMLAIPFMSVEAAGNAETGELLITSEKMTGEVGEIVKVDFYLYPNLPDGRKLDSLSGTMKYDPEFVTLGAINQVDEEKNLTSLMKGKASSFQHNIDSNGILRFAFIDAYGVEAEGFWFQAEFRIEKTGATEFIFNGITYTGIDSAYKAVTFVIDPVSVGGIYTEGETVPTEGAAEETFAPLTPVVETPAAATPTPKPSNNGQTVPVTSSLPTYSAKPTAEGIVTPAPAVTSIPMRTPDPQTETPAPAPQAETPAPVGEQTPEPAVVAETNDPGQIAEATEAPNSGNEPAAEATSDPVYTIEPETPTDPGKSAEPASTEQTPENTTDEKDGNSDLWLIIGLIAGMVAVVGLGALAIVLLLRRRRMNEE